MPGASEIDFQYTELQGDPKYSQKIEKAETPFRSLSLNYILAANQFAALRTASESF